MRRLAIFTAALIVCAVTVGFVVANCQTLGQLEQGQHTIATEHHDGHSHEHPAENSSGVHCPNPFDHFVLSRSFVPNYQQIELRLAAAVAAGAAEDLSGLAYSASHGPPGILNLPIPAYLRFSVLRI